MKKDEIKVNVENGVLSVSGERKTEKEEKNKKFHRIERSYGTFERSFIAAGRRRRREGVGGIQGRCAQGAPAEKPGRQNQRRSR